MTPSTLIRRPTPAAVTPCAPAQPMRVVLTGPLLEDAFSGTEPATGRASFSVTLAQGAGEPVVVATRWVGDGPDAAFYAAERAQALRAGDIVTVHGDGLRIRYRHGTLAYFVGSVRDIEIEQRSAERHASTDSLTTDLPTTERTT
jgi:hypothetical protein